MKRGTIIVNRNGVTLTDNVWLTDYEIAELFGVTMPAVHGNIKSIFKSGMLSERDVYRYIRLENGNRADVYNMEMITSLAFRLNTYPAAVFRKWLVKKATAPRHTTPPIVIRYKDGLLNWTEHRNGQASKPARCRFQLSDTFVGKFLRTD